MTNQQDPWNNQQRPLGQQFKYVLIHLVIFFVPYDFETNISQNSRQHPPVLPPPATLEAGMYNINE